MKNGILGLVVFGFISGVALADDIYLGQPIYGGSGCPQGTASAVLTEDGKTLTVLFDSYMVQAGYGSGKTIDRKSCNLAVPVHVPQGYSVAVMQIDYRGFNSLPQGAMSTFNAEYFFANQVGPRYSKRFMGPLDSDFITTNRLGVEAVVWSQCGTDVMLRANTGLMVKNNNFNQDALSSVDSADIKAGLVYHLEWRRCGGF